LTGALTNVETKPTPCIKTNGDKSAPFNVASSGVPQGCPISLRAPKQCLGPLLGAGTTWEKRCPTHGAGEPEERRDSNWTTRRSTQNTPTINSSHSLQASHVTPSRSMTGANGDTSRYIHGPKQCMCRPSGLSRIGNGFQVPSRCSHHKRGGGHSTGSHKAEFVFTLASFVAHLASVCS